MQSGEQRWGYYSCVGNKKDELRVVNPPVDSCCSAHYNPSFVVRPQIIHFSSCRMLKSISFLMLTGFVKLTGSIFRWRRKRGPRWCSPSAMPPWPSRRTGTRGASRRRRRRRWWWASWLACSCSAGSPSSSPSSSSRCAPVTSRPSGRASSCGWDTPTPSSTHSSTPPSIRTTTTLWGTCSPGNAEPDGDSPLNPPLHYLSYDEKHRKHLKMDSIYSRLFTSILK